MMTMFPEQIHVWIKAGLFDVAVASAVRELFDVAGVDDIPDEAWLLACLTLRAYGDGHSRLNLDGDSLMSWRPEGPGFWPTDTDLVRDAMSAVPSVFGDESTAGKGGRTPFVISNDGLYIARVLHEEQRVAQWLRADDGARVRIILGGPGTGKTYTIAKRLREDSSSFRSVALCAPTGKASRHLRTVLDRQLRENGADQSVLDLIENAPSETAHRLLGYNPNGQSRYGHTIGSPLEYKLVIVDEASMMSLSLMHALLRALPEDGEVWLVGDPDQLASVDAGSVLADIRRAAAREDNFLFPRTTVLSDQHRFGEDSAIAALATAVRDKDLEKVRDVLESDADDVEWIDPARDRESMRALTHLVDGHAKEVVRAAAAGDVAKALATKARLQVLCATRIGLSGVEGWNDSIEQRLGSVTASRAYVGRPVMVTRNDGATGLSNGDVGVICKVAGEERVFFGDPANPVEVSMARLPDVVTVHALTIHKSQGSEYDHAVVVIPERENRVLTRELLYTGVTRPRTKLTLVATWESIENAIGRDARRATGLENRLVDGSLHD